MRYSFICKECENIQDEFFSAASYDEYVVPDGNEEGLLLNGVCEKCGSKRLFRTIISAPSVLGGTTGYKSMERYWQENKGEARRREDELSKKLEDRRRKRVLDRINKQVVNDADRTRRHKDYGKGQGEQKLG